MIAFLVGVGAIASAFIAYVFLTSVCDELEDYLAVFFAVLIMVAGSVVTGVCVLELLK